MPVYQLSDKLLFPPAELAEKDGLLAIGGDLSPERLLLAYSSGIFPWYSEGDPILWWSPSPRRITSYNVCYTKLLREYLGTDKPEKLFNFGLYFQTDKTELEMGLRFLPELEGIMVSL